MDQVPSTHMVCNFSSRGSATLFWPLQVLLQVIHTHTEYSYLKERNQESLGLREGVWVCVGRHVHAVVCMWKSVDTL